MTIGSRFRAARSGLERAYRRRRAAHGQRRGNAPLDPLGHDDPSPGDLAATFRILRASAVLGHEGPLESFDTYASTADAYFGDDSPPELVLFVSHRWATRRHPDPSGTTADSVRYVLRALHDLIEQLERPPAERVDRVPSLLVHGVVQAAQIAVQPRRFGEVGAGRFDHELAERLRAEPASVLDRIGIWYDFSCLPQVGPAGNSLTADQQAFVTGALARLHTLIAASHLLSIRHAGDDYPHRGWCAAELSVGQPAFRHHIVRTDLLGTPIPPEDLVGEQQAEMVREAAQLWATEDSGLGALLGLSTAIFFSSDAIEEQRHTPMVVSPRPPALFPGHKAMLLTMIQALGTAAQLDESDAETLTVDVGDLVRWSLEQADLRFTDPDDRVYVGLMILYARHVGAPEFAAFYQACIERHLAGTHLRLARYREVRDLATMRAWWRFQGEPESPLPRWARR